VLQLIELHPLLQTMERRDTGLASIKSGLLRCGIATRRMSGNGVKTRIRLFEAYVSFH